MRKLNLVVLLYLFMLSGISFGGWEKTYGGIYNEAAYSLAITPNGNYILAGYTWQFAAPKYFCLVKVNNWGDSIWVREYGEGVAYSVVITDDGDYISSGSFYHAVTDNWYCIVKVTSDGDTIWTREFDGRFIDNSSIVQESDGEYVVVWNLDISEHDLFIMKMDSSGDTSWTRVIGRDLNDWANCVVEASNNSCIIVGSTDIGTSVNPDVYIVKIDSLGEMMWDRNYGGLGTNRASFVSATYDSCYIVVGSTSLYYSTLFDVYLLKINEDGDTLWSRKFGGPNNDGGACVRQTWDGGYIIVGSTYSYGIGTPDSSNVYLVKTDSEGYVVWERTFGGTGNDIGYSVSQTQDGGYIIAGVYDQGPHTDVYLIKTNWLGYTDVEENEALQPLAHTLYVYPNPFNSSCRIAVGGSRLAVSGPAPTVEVFDITGRLVGQFGEPNTDNRTPNTDFVWQPAENTASSVYLVRATVGEETITKRVVYLR